MNDSEFRALVEDEMIKEIERLRNDNSCLKFELEGMDRLRKKDNEYLIARAERAEKRLRAVVRDASVLSDTPQEVIMTAADYVRCERCEKIDETTWPGKCDCTYGWRPRAE